MPSTLPSFSAPPARSQIKVLSSLSHHLQALNRKQKWLLLLLIPLFVLGGYFGMPAPDIVENIADGHAMVPLLETSFWLSILATTFLSFFCMEAIFRSKDTLFLATLPVHPSALFFHKMARVFELIGISSIFILAFWFSSIFSSPAIGFSCFALWITGLFLTAALSFAIILYASSSSSAGQMTTFGPAAFVAAPAISLALSVVGVLLLKLGFEAVIVAGWNNAAYTAFGITAGTFFFSLAYANHAFKKNYYNALANFLQNDLIVINQDYQFVDNKALNQIKLANSPIRALIQKDIIQYNRRFALSRIMVYLYAIILAILICSVETIRFNLDHLLFLPCLTIFPIVIFAFPWIRLTNNDLEPGMLNILPIDPQSVRKAKFTASGILSFQLLIPLVIATAFSLWLLDKNAADIALNALLTVVVAVFSILLPSFSSLWLPKSKWPATMAIGAALLLGTLLV